MNINFNPLSDFIILRWEKQTETKSGVLLSDISKSKPHTAKVVAVGPGKLDRHGNFIKVTINPGDTVIVDPFIPVPIKIEGEELWVARESDIYAILCRKSQKK